MGRKEDQWGKEGRRWWAGEEGDVGRRRGMPPWQGGVQAVACGFAWSLRRQECEVLFDGCDVSGFMWSGVVLGVVSVSSCCRFGGWPVWLHIAHTMRQCVPHMTHPSDL